MGEGIGIDDDVGAGRQLVDVKGRESRTEDDAHDATGAPLHGLALADGALVLVVADDPEARRFLVESLRAVFRVVTALDGDGVARALELKPDLILADLTMPPRDGGDLVDAMRRHKGLEATPILLLAATIDDDLRARLGPGGAQGFLTRPFSVEELRLRVEKVVTRTRAEASVRRAEARFRGILSLAADAIITVDEAQRIVLYNEGAEEIFGWSQAEAIGKPLELLIPGRFRGEHRGRVDEFAAGIRKARRMRDPTVEIFGLRKSGEEFPADCAISKLELDGTKLFTAVVRDATERKLAEKEQRFFADVGALLASSLELDERVAGIARLAARDLADLCLIDFVEDDGRTWRLKAASADPVMAPACALLEQLPPERRRLHTLSTVFDAKQPVLIEEVTPELIASFAPTAEHLEVLRILDPTSVIVVPLLARGRLLGAIVLVSSHPSRRYQARDLRVAEELARRAALAIENARLYRHAMRATQFRDEVMGVVAHDLRNPLNAIVLAATLLDHQLGANEVNRARKNVSRILHASNRLDRLVHDLLDVTSLEAGHLSIEAGRLRTDEFVRDAADAQRPMAESASLRLRLAVAPDLPDTRGDGVRLLQVFDNLIGNAVKFTRAGGQITVGAKALDEAVLFWVGDTGEGIAAENLPHLFDRFWQGRKDVRRGAGLGLSIAKGIVEAHGGRIWVESAPDHGSTFFFTIPTVPPLAAPTCETDSRPA